MSKIVPDVGIAPIYQLELKTGDNPEPSSTSSVVAEAGSALIIKCTMDEGFEEIKLQKHDEPIPGVQYEGNSATLFVPSYEFDHEGLYICGSKRKGGDAYHERQLRLSTKGKKPEGAPCPAADDKMCLHGNCAMQLGRPTCFCDPNYDGVTCDTLMIPDFTNQAIKVVAGAGSFNIAWIGLTIIFAVLFLKQRRKLRLMVDYYGPIPTPDIYGELPKNPYVLPSECKEDITPSTQKMHNFPPEPPRQSSFKKFRNAVRTRLPGTSDSRLLRQQEIV